MEKFENLTESEILLLEGGCGVCKAGGAIGGAASGAGLVLLLASNPAGWAIAGGAAVGAGLGYLVAA